MSRIMIVARKLDSGGVTTHIMSLAQGLRAEGHEVCLCSSIKEDCTSHGSLWFENAGFKHYIIPFPGRTSIMKRIIDTIKSLFMFAALVCKVRPDIIHVHHRSTSLFVKLASLLTQVPFVVTLHLYPISKGLLSNLYSFWGYRTIAISKETRKHLIEDFNVPEQRIVTIYNGVDEKKYYLGTGEERSRSRAMLNVETDDFVLCIVARLSSEKNHKLLFQAMLDLSAKIPKIKLIVAGIGSKEQEYKKLVQFIGMDEKIIFVGYVDPRNVYWASDIFVLPSKVEGFPMSVVEAMLCGAIVVRTPAGGAYDQIQNYINGFIIPFDNKDEIVNIIKYLYFHTEERQAIRLRAREIAEKKFTCKIMSKKTIEVYCQSGAC